MDEPTQPVFIDALGLIPDIIKGIESSDNGSYSFPGGVVEWSLDPDGVCLSVGSVGPLKYCWTAFSAPVLPIDFKRAWLETAIFNIGTYPYLGESE